VWAPVTEGTAWSGVWVPADVSVGASVGVSVGAALGALVPEGRADALSATNFFAVFEVRVTNGPGLQQVGAGTLRRDACGDMIIGLGSALTETQLVFQAARGRGKRATTCVDNGLRFRNALFGAGRELAREICPFCGSGASEEDRGKIEDGGTHI